jgi:polyphosphate kinase
MEANYRPLKYKSLVVAPFYMRNHFLHLLTNEIHNAAAGKEAWVIVKLNNLVDEAIIKKLYKASQAGVHIKLIIRGICVLVPGQPGLSENIEAISIVDRFLEHSRVLIFANNGHPLYFITSADWMVRNFDNRIEVACPIYNKDIQQEILDMINIQLKDNVKARILGPGEANKYKKTGRIQIRSQIETYNYFKKKLSGNN